MRRERIVNIIVVAVALVALLFSIWGPEKLAMYQDRGVLNQISVEAVEHGREGYRYTLSSNEKLYILSKCLNNQVRPESELSSLTRVEVSDVDYEELTGTYAFVVNRQGPSDMEITEEEIFEICNQELETLKELGILPDGVKKMSASSYNAELYSAIDVLEPRNNMAVWKISLSTDVQNADKANRLLDAYVDADTGKIYEFYVRTGKSWNDMEPDGIAEAWSEYLGLEGMEAYEAANPLSETTQYFEKYRFPGIDEGNTVMTIGFYEGINEFFLKIEK
ncbi:MAG: hypothetical protein NC417_01865 [Candidatus Gastranaerophilales bacterium]|nr:hypothetical protein [Candidatus Gastranaerophilales bacterium]